MEIIEQKQNNLLNRQEIVLTLEQESIPSKNEIAKMLAKQFKTEEENIIIKKINSKFGSKKFEISAKIYKDAESRQKYEVITRKQRKKQREQTEPKQEANKPEEQPTS